MFKRNKGAKSGHRKKIPKALIIVIAIAVLAVVGLVLFSKFGGQDKKETVNTAKVERGDISKVIEASGTIQPNDEYSVTSMLKGDIIADYIEEGQQVKEGDILYEIDPDDVNKNITTAKENIQKAADLLNTAKKNQSDLTVKFSFGGVITDINVKNGDDVSAGQQLATVKDTENLVLKVPFNVDDAGKLRNGESAAITLASSNSVVYGTVKTVSSGSVVNSEGVPVKNVEINVKNPGAIVEGEMATVMVGDIACNSYGTFFYGSEKTYTAAAGGKVTGLSYVVGDKVRGGDSLLTVDSDDTATRVTDAQIAYNQAVRQLNDLNESLDDDYKIKAKVTGKIVQKNSKKGDTLDTTNGAAVMAIIQDVNSLKFNMTVDELDITYMKEGQTVEVTADAVEGVTYIGKIKTVSTVGTTANGVTTYPVEVTLEGKDIESAEKAVFGEKDYKRKLIPGMNVDANVIVESREDVIRVPVAAVQRGNTVVVKSKGSGKKAANTDKNADSATDVRIPGGITVPDGFETVQVETGLSDDDYIEITSGLSVGDEIVVPEVVIENNGDMFRIMGGHPGENMGGSAPSGGGAPSDGGGGGAPSGGPGGGQ